MHLKVFSLLMAVYFTLGSVFPSTDFTQLAKVPNMWSHFIQHRDMAMEQGKEVGLVDFFRFHFYTPSEHQGEHDHDDLPYHSVNSGTNTLLIQEIEMDCNPVVEAKRTRAEFFYLVNYHFNYSSRLLQPPASILG